MNEIIQQLIKQASYSIIETNDAPIISNEFNKEKFVELIIRECAESIEKTIKDDCMSFRAKQACELVSILMLEHFGFKE